MNNKKAKEKKSLLPLIKFFGIFIGIIAAYYIFVAVANESFFNSYLNFTANIASLIMNIFGQETTVQGTLIGSKTTVMLLSFGCEGTEPIVIFLAGMIAFPIVFKQKWIQIIVGVLGLYVLNFLRIIALYFVQMNNPKQFETYHTIIFPILFILFALICLGLCIKWASKK